MARRIYKLKHYWVQDLRTDVLEKDVRKIETEGLFEGLLLMKSDEVDYGDQDVHGVIKRDIGVICDELEIRLFGERV